MKITLEPGGPFPPSPLVAANIRAALEAAMVVVGTEAPVLQPGDSITVWVNPSTGDVNLFAGTDLVNFTPRNCVVSGTAPTSPVSGTQWFNTNDGNTYTRYNNVWVQN